MAGRVARGGVGGGRGGGQKAIAQFVGKFYFIGMWREERRKTHELLYYINKKGYYIKNFRKINWRRGTPTLLTTQRFLRPTTTTETDRPNANRDATTDESRRTTEERTTKRHENERNDEPGDRRNNTGETRFVQRGNFFKCAK